MKVVTTKEELARELAKLEGTRSLVMTMGALHEGHLSLVERATAETDHTIVSIFVNPLQFGPGEDYEAYPRTLDADVALLEPAGVDVVFAPEVEEMYPREPLVRINPGPVATVLEGKTRPTHFAGVLQIVHKVMNLVRPQLAYFGQKDAQQLALIRTMVADLDMNLEIRAVPIKREESGLAMSSRNSYLSQAEREDALALSRALADGKAAADASGAAGEVLAAARESIEGANVRVDYLVLVDPETFQELEAGAHGAGLLAVAAYVGPTRLIDNMEVSIA
ncbi:pantoate--beta-alanine ligase [Arcanobacterium wilhelmae]|uniref:Pantothenate synthetase n=1 Tax=Arcanobacterium wilhelmae TaxID=1803177 RepID=A0ABT9NA86_9ACTO|nr:pantoate--beta-alanine ligase [Arcanobacterium wilhelmae]MDP9800606.1 pantoate--beta-alanine ligase [Arcanobacterium wilhelmae]WFN90014.1 pantoate--beta-alanine ligase [Arcanobacterium wilhelmae]